MRWLVAVVLVACGSPPPTCEQALAHAAAVRLEDAWSRAKMLDICNANEWSADVRHCLATATTSLGARDCLLPVDTQLVEVYMHQSNEAAKQAQDAIAAAHSSAAAA